jgi:hypothetical protein
LLLLGANASGSSTNINDMTPHSLFQEKNSTSVPLAIAMPGYATLDAALESWMEIESKEDIESATALVFSRSTALS